jgi:hypothetical protein
MKKTSHDSNIKGASNLARRSKWSVVCGVAAISAVYAVPAAADQLSDLQAQVNALNEAILLMKADQGRQKADVAKSADAGKGSMPGSFKIPGTQTSVKIGGFIKADYTYDINHWVDDFAAGWRFTVDPADMARKGATHFMAQQSRINFSTSTPTSMGDLKTFVEGDFWGDTRGDERGTMNAAGWRVRLAYAELGRWTAGQLATNFFHGPSFPDTLDVNSPTGQALLRSPQIRYTMPVGAATLSLSAEDPFTDVPGTNSKGVSDKMPDLTARMAFKGDWGTTSVQGVVRSLNNDSRTPAGGTYKSKTGWGIGIAGNIKTVGKDDLRFQYNFGDGIGRYSQGAIFHAAGVDPATREFVTTKAHGGYLAYRHFWTDDLRSTIAAGYARMKNNPAYLNSISFGGTTTWGNLKGNSGATNVLKSLHTNLIWTPVKNVDVGLEYMQGYRERAVMSEAGGTSGTFKRLQATGKYSF